MSLRRRLVIATLLLLLAFALAWAARFSILAAMGRWLDVAQRPRPAEYVMVLTGDGDTRPFAAAALIKAGLGDRPWSPKRWNVPIFVSATMGLSPSPP